MNKMFFYIFYKTKDCGTYDVMHVQKLKAWNKIEARELFLTSIKDKNYIVNVKVLNEVEYTSILKSDAVIRN